jgi:2-succinyl-5-enolpyruvyl-6-hydroxy-3-cyclohexene-1-carboxylate synthase
MNDDLALAVVQECERAGVTEYCLCAGSRNSELVRMVLTSAARCWHFFEERSAAFFALGRVRVTERPVAVVTTSGTAAVEIFPAIVEAHYQGLPLLAVTADRPRNYRFSGAPQAINQENLYGDYPQVSADVNSAEQAQDSLWGWTQEGPAHLNVCLEEPKLDVTAYAAAGTRHEFKEIIANSSPPLAKAIHADIILLGELLPQEQERVKHLLQEWHGPVWAEAASGLRTWLGTRLVRGGEGALRHLPVRSVLRLGGVPSCRFWRDLEAKPDVNVVSVSRSGYSGLGRASRSLEWSEIALEPYAATFQDMPVADVIGKFPHSECGYFHDLSWRIPEEAALFLGNSLAIRQWNLAAEPRGAEGQCHVMRGANGIDGNLSFFYGTAAEAEEAWAVVGDLTALYDLAAPWIIDQLPAARRRIVVMNNGGGLIFRRLPSLQGLEVKAKRVIENTHDLRFQHWAAQWGMDYLLITSLSDWPAQLPEGDVVIEILPDAEQSDAFWAALAQREQETYG